MTRSIDPFVQSRRMFLSTVVPACSIGPVPPRCCSFAEGKALPRTSGLIRCPSGGNLR
jgi:hypothetical protein